LDDNVGKSHIAWVSHTTPITHHLIYLKSYQNSHPSCYAFGYPYSDIIRAECKIPVVKGLFNVLLGCGPGGILG